MAQDLTDAELLRVEVANRVLQYATGVITYVDSLGNHQVLSTIADAALQIIDPDEESGRGAVAIYAPDVAPYRVEYEVQGDRIKRFTHLLAALPAPDPLVFPNLRDVYLAVHGPLVVDPGLRPVIDGQEFTGDAWTAGQIPLVDGDGHAVHVLDHIWARSASGRPSAGQYRLVDDLTGGLQIYELLPYWWLQSLTPADYPVVVDPTVIATGSAPLYGSGRRMAQLTDGTLVLAMATGSGTRVYVSKDAGATWPAVTAPASGIVSTLNGAVALDVDADSRVHALIGSISLNSAMVYQQWQFSADRLSITVVETQVEAPAGAQYIWAYMDLTVWGAAGATKNLAMCYVQVNSGDTTSNMFLYARTAFVTTAGVLTLGARYQKDSVVRGGEVYHVALSRKSDDTIKILWSMNNTNAGGPFIKVATIDGAATSISTTISVSNVVGIDGFSSFYWVAVYGTQMVVYNDTTSVGGTVTNWTASGNALAVLPDVTNNRFVVFARRGTALTNPEYPGWFEYSVGANAWTDKGALNTSIKAGYAIVCPRRNFDGTRAHLAYIDAAANNDVYHEAASYNTAPTAPTNLNVRSASAPTATEAFVPSETSTWSATPTDPDPGDSFAQYEVDFRDSGGNVIAGVSGVFTAGGSMGTPFSFTVAAGAFTAETNGTWRIRFKDGGGSWGAWSTYATWKARSRPTTAITAPAAGTVSSGDVTLSATYAQTGGAAKGSHQVLLLPDGGTPGVTAPITDTGWVANSDSPFARTFTGLANTTNYRLAARSRTADGVESPWVTVDIATSFTAPAEASNLAATAFPGGARIRLTWGAPAVPSGVESGNYLVDRKLAAAPDSQYRTLVQSSSDTSYDDYTAASNQSYTYRVRTIGSNGVLSSGVTVAGSVAFMIPHLVHPTDPAQNLPLPFTPREWILDHPQSVTVTETLGASRKTVSVGRVLGAEMELTVVADHRNPRSFDVAAKLRGLKALGTTWLLKLPHQPGPLMASIPGRVFEVSLGVMREVLGPTRTVITIPAVEVGDELR